jgi:predicted transcriptional regulator
MFSLLLVPQCHNFYVALTALMNFISMEVEVKCMKQSLATVSFSVDADMKRDLDKLAKAEGRSKSDIFREMYNYYMFKRSLAEVQAKGRVIAARLGLRNEDDVVDYIKGRGRFAEKNTA